MRVSELASALKVTPDTVRFYTRRGLLSPTRNAFNGYKGYGKSDQRRLRFIVSARQLGFSVDDIDQILREADGGNAACPLVRRLIRQRLEETEEQFQEALTLRKRMHSAMQEWESKPNRTPDSHAICHLVEGFFK